MKKGFLLLMCLCCGLGVLTSCSEDSDEYDAHANWPGRNSEYFIRIANEARTAIAAARAEYGDDWEAHCDWRMYKATTKAPGSAGALTDSICVHFEEYGTGTGMPLYSDTVRVHYKGYLMPTQDMVNGNLVDKEEVFSYSFMGELNPEQAGTACSGFSSPIKE